MLLLSPGLLYIGGKIAHLLHLTKGDSYATMTPVRKQGVQVVAEKYFTVDVRNESESFKVVVRAIDRASASSEVSQVITGIGSDVRMVGGIVELNALPVDATQVEGNENAWIDNNPINDKFIFSGDVKLEAPKSDVVVDDSDWASKPLIFDEE